MNHPKRLRIFAGPNGSGKSSLVTIISDKQVDLGIYVNADDIKKILEETRSLDFAIFSLYLYFISLENSRLCINRVKARVDQGGHDVPVQKITERYERTMNFLLDAIRLADRAFLFDNSYSSPKLVATAENEQIKLENTSYAPLWFQKYVLEKL